ncbi:hypothetical protein SEA_ECLIPTUS_84 [Gordonia phage Ecliptus]|uniref:Uncharacterized protein n=2 Tax=Langleyhallvirinae TaxID=2732613 RepID=A0A385E1N8_9CAUD|nr:hypothetical protein HOT93_gp070 [Gordonia phage Horus]YP_009808418.1 hypothetical protein HOT94_gp077 [Gordonia phage Phistory]QYC53745.1 hypothetical protein SEA_LEROY_79 [Gordonia phage Leroy]WAB10649.1 hypothetical protein SEA_ECLIPTUS_84 [Gordonia phage Ecliptus]WNM69785.1 hypothetical protein SEA_CRATER_78 [Gordonia phage Crater]AXQ63932.1 hypothetical protein SEA_HORUS_80 [Gordonia phage Horus]AXQ64782.1 hypothetical protein SEA_PHISTORY_77 [Gordonia phage Phistory]
MSIADEARAKLEGITPGPWSAEHFPWHHDDDPEWEVESHALQFDDPIGIAGHGVEQGKADAEFIAAAPELVDGLLAELDAAEQLLVQQGVLGKRCRRLTAERDAALATIQQVRELADKWEREAGPGSRAEQAYGRQVVSVEFAVTTLRRILGGES